MMLLHSRYGTGIKDERDGLSSAPSHISSVTLGRWMAGWAHCGRGLCQARTVTTSPFILTAVPPSSCSSSRNWVAEMLREVLPCHPQSGFPDPAQCLGLLEPQVGTLVIPSLEQMLLLSLWPGHFTFCVFLTCSFSSSLGLPLVFSALPPVLLPSGNRTN